MIIFMDNPNYIQVIHDGLGCDVLVYNLSSLYSGFESISNLMINIALQNRGQLSIPEYVNSVQFDQLYANNILNTPELFHSFMTIVYGSYLGYATCILVQRDPYRDAIMESIIKLIQQRYGINSWIIEDIDDVYDIYESRPTTFGLMQLDEDIKLHNEMYRKGAVRPLIGSDISIE